MYTFHILPNAHIDPVWQWDAREGLTQGIRSMRSVLNLMDEFPELTYMRGEAVLYRHLEEHDPETFARVKAQIAAGRWDVIGGTWLQPDTNLPGVETLVRQYTEGLDYFERHLGVRPRAAWAADSFGHTAGMPDVLAAAGMDSFSFTRPFAGTLPTAKPAFWWRGPSGAKILCYRPECGWYGANRAEVLPRLDATLEWAKKFDLENVAVYIGLGDHGGGPTRQQILDVRAWSEKHPEVKIAYGGLHSLFAALRKEIAAKGGDDFLPTVEGELNYTLRGCYTSAARHKFLFRQTEAALASAERTDALVRTALEQVPEPQPEAWRGLLFNTFHDILPGSSIERAHAEQIQWLGSVRHSARLQALDALDALSFAVDTSVAKPVGDMPEVLPFLVWNPNPWEYRGPLELEGCMDDRPDYHGDMKHGPIEMRDPSGKKVPFQIIPAEGHNADSNWRTRSVFQAKVPALGWAVYTMGWVAKTTMPALTTKVAVPKKNTITNGLFTVSASKDAEGVKILRDGKPFLKGKGLQAALFRDPMGSWGSDAVRQYDTAVPPEFWTIDRVEVTESGPVRAALFVRLAAPGAASWITLTFKLAAGRDAVDVDARILWNERGRRLKLVLPVGAKAADYAVPGAVVRRDDAQGEVPGGSWVRALGAKDAPVLSFASNALYGFDIEDGAFRPSVIRASGYAYSPRRDDGREMDAWRHATDLGELDFSFVLAPGDAPIERLAAELESPLLSVIAPKSAKAELGRSGSLAALAPASLQLLAFKPAEDGTGDLVLRVRETAGRAAKAAFTLPGRDKPLALGTVPAFGIATWRIADVLSVGADPVVTPVKADENP